MTSRISAETPPMPRDGHAPTGANTLTLPEFLREPFSAAMSQSILLPAFIALFGIIAALFLVNFAREGGGLPGQMPQYGVVGSGYDDFDDDDYVEYILRREPHVREEETEAEGDTEPLHARFRHPRPAHADAWHSDPVESWHSLRDEPVSVARAEPIGFAYNGFHVDDGQRFRPIVPFSRPAFEPRRHVDPRESPSARRQTGSEGAHARPSGRGSSARDQLAGGEPPRNKHYRADPEDPISGRHSS
jgi:hypothetical protein